MMFSNVVMNKSVLSSANDLDQVGASIGFADNGGRELQVPGVTEDRYDLAGKECFLQQPHWSWYSALLSGILVEMITFSISMWVSVPDLLWHSSA